MTARIMSFSREKEVTLEWRGATYTDLAQKLGLSITLECWPLCVQSSQPSIFEYDMNNQLHGVTLEAIVTRLQEHYGWEQLAQRIEINCFISDPSIKSSLKFLRKTPWARTQVEELYLATTF
jgi:hypothetical protein